MDDDAIRAGVAERIYSERKARGWSLAELASKLRGGNGGKSEKHISKEMVRHLETGKCNLTVCRLYEIGTALGIEPKKLLPPIKRATEREHA
jgi:transcriptional regulator with XRE-family HTH domain